MQIFLFVFMLYPMLLGAREINVTGCRNSRENLAVLQEINALDKLIQQVFHFKKHYPDEKRLEVEFRRHGSLQLLLFRRSMRLYLPESAEWQSNPVMFRAVVSALVLSRRCKKMPSDALRAIPEWICAGLREKRRTAEEEEQLLRGLPDMPAVSAMYVKNMLPDMKKLIQLNVPCTPELQRWYDQFARILLETAEKKKMMTRYAEKLAAAEDPLSCSDRFTRDTLAVFNQKSARTGDNLTLNQILWSTYKPEPAARKLAQWDKAMSWEMPEVDKDGKLTEKIRKCTIPELPLLLLNRPDIKEQLKLVGDALREYAVGCSSSEADQLHRLRLLINNQSPDKEAVLRQVEQITTRLKEMFRHRQEIEKKLSGAEIRYLGAKEAFPLGLQVYVTGSSASPAQEAFLRKTEKIYGD